MKIFSKTFISSFPRKIPPFRLDVVPDRAKTLATVFQERGKKALYQANKKFYRARLIFSAAVHLQDLQDKLPTGWDIFLFSWTGEAGKFFANVNEHLKLAGTALKAGSFLFSSIDLLSSVKHIWKRNKILRKFSKDFSEQDKSAGEKYLRNKVSQLKLDATSLGIDAISLVCAAAESAFSYGCWIGKIPVGIGTAASGGLSIAGSITAIFFAGGALLKAKRKVGEAERWAKDSRFKGETSSIDEILKKRRRQEEEWKTEAKKIVEENLIDALNQDRFFQDLKIKGIDVDKVLSQKEKKNFFLLWKQGDALQEKIACAYAQSKNASLIGVKNGLSSLSLCKFSQAKGNLRLHFHKAQVLFVGSLAFSAAAIILQSMALAGVLALPLFASFAPGAAILLLALALLIITNAYFFKKNPHLFKEKVFLVPLRLFYRQARVLFAKLKKKRAQKQLKTLSSKKIKLKNEKVESEKSIKKQKIRLKKLRKQENDLERKNEERDAQLKEEKEKRDKLKARLRVAGAADFAKQANLIRPLKEAEEIGRETDLSISQTLTEAIEKHREDLSSREEIEALLKANWNLSLQGKKEEIETDIEKFLGMTDPQILKFIDKLLYEESKQIFSKKSA